MAKKLLPNRISKVITDENIAQLRVIVNEAINILGVDTSIPDPDYKSLRKISDVLKRETDDVREIMEGAKELVEEPLTVEEIDKDKDYYEKCDTIRAILKPLYYKLEKEQNIAGAEYANACSVFEEDVERKAQRGSTKAKSVKAQLDAIDRNRGGGLQSKSSETPPK